MAETQTYEPRLKSEYRARIRPAMKEQFNYSNEMRIPRLDKIVVNMGIGEAVGDSKKAQSAMKDLAAITGQKPLPTKARKVSTRAGSRRIWSPVCGRTAAFGRSRILRRTASSSANR